jgi:Tfp pilus assembly protein PilO
MVSGVIAAAILAIFWLFIWSPNATRREELTQQLQAQRTEVERLRRLAETRDQKEREYAQLSARIRDIEVKLPPEREIPRFLRQLQDVATSLGIKLTLLRPGPTQAGPASTVPAPGGAQPAPATPGAQPAPPRPRYQQFRVDMSFDGSYGDFLAFASRLEDFPRFLVLSGFSIAPGELPKLKVTMNANTFVLPKDVPAPTP